MGELIYEKETYAVKGAIFEVYKTMGAGFLESVYQECLEEELKAVSALAPEHSAQLFNYLRSTKMRLGLLVNFGHYPGVEVKRIAL